MEIEHGGKMDSRHQALLPDEFEQPGLAAPPERFTVLALFSLMAMSQATAWVSEIRLFHFVCLLMTLLHPANEKNFFGPISGPCNVVYGWSDGTIAWLANTANIAMVLAIPMSSAIATRVGLRGATAGCGLLCVLCTVHALLFG